MIARPAPHRTLGPHRTPHLPPDPGRDLGPHLGPGLGITVSDLTVEYRSATGPVRALDEVTLTVRPGASIAIVGPSGSGKSTLLGVVGALEEPTSGVVRVGPHLLTAMTDAERAELRRRRFGFVFQADNLQPFLTVAENVGLQAMLAGQADDPARTRALLDALGVGTLADRFPDQLSGGQRQRVAVARALVHDPGLVLADEPTGSLDEASARRVVELLLGHHRATGCTLVVVTHDRAVARQLGTVVELTAGRVQESR